MPARVLMQDFTGVPAIVDLAAMRDAVAELGGDAQKVDPAIPVDLVIDHSIIAGRRRDPRTRSRATWSSSTNEIRSGTPSCAGRSRRSARCACSRRIRGSVTR